jgi:predicted transcriptional regulator
VVDLLEDINGELIKQLRKEKGLTQQSLAEKSHVSQAHIARIENGTVDPRLSTVNALIGALSSDIMTLKVKDVMSKPIHSVKPNETIQEASRLMIELGISQIPVISNGVVGTITERDIIRRITSNPTVKDLLVSDLMSDPLPTISETSLLSDIEPILEVFPAVIVSQIGGNLVGIVSRADIIRTI